jgi:hypothetical protein
MKHFFLLIIVLLGLVAPAAQAASSAEGTGGGGEPTPSADQTIMTEVQATGEAHLYPTASAPQVGRVEPGDTVRVIEQLDDWYRIEVVERALGGPVIPLADGWVAEDVFGEPLDGVPPASRPTPVPTVTATPSSSPSVEGLPSNEPTGVPTSVPRDAGSSPTAVPTQIPLDYAVPVPVEDALPGRGQSTGTGGTAPVVSRPAVPVSRVIIVQQCNDVNENRQCEVTEGIAGVVGYVVNVRTGQVVGQSVSNTRGITQIPITTLSSEQLVLNVPFLDEYQSLTGNDGRTVPIVRNSVGLSGLLP